MKKILSSFIIFSILLLNSSNTFAWGWHIWGLEYSYNWEYKTLEENKNLTLEGYINPTTLKFWDDWVYWINLYNFENILEDIWAKHFVNNKSLWLFYSEDKFPEDLNKWLMLFLSNKTLESLNSTDSTYFETWKQKMYNNWNNAHSINSNIKWGINPKTEIINKISEKSKIMINWQIKNINIDENFDYCSYFYKDRNWNFIDSNAKEECNILIREIKKEYLNWYLNDDEFYQKFKSTWNSKISINKKLNTKIFIVDTIIIDWKAYWNYSKIYNVPVPMKKQLDKISKIISNWSFEKKEELLWKIWNLLVFQKYWSKNYEILKYLEEKINNTYSEKRLKDAQEILDWLSVEFDLKEVFGNFITDQ